MNLDVNLSIETRDFGGYVLVMLEVHQWSGSRRLKKEALIAKNPEFANLPPQKLATLGGTKICDPAELAPNANRKREGLKVLRDNGLPFMKGWLIPEARWDFVYAELVRIKGEFDDLTVSLYTRYDMAIANWRNDKENVAWAHLVEDVPDADTVCGKMSFDIHPVRVQAPSASDNHPSNAGYVTQMTGLKGELFADAARESEILITKYLMGEDKATGVVRRREKITQKTIRPLVRICEKFESFANLDPTIEPLAEMISHVLGLLPAEGAIEGVHLMHVWQVAQCLAEPERALQMARVAFDKGSSADAFEHLLTANKCATVETPLVIPQAAHPVYEMSTTTGTQSDLEEDSLSEVQLHIDVPKASYIGLF